MTDCKMIFGEDANDMAILIENSVDMYVEKMRKDLEIYSKLDDDTKNKMEENLTKAERLSHLLYVFCEYDKDMEEAMEMERLEKEDMNTYYGMASYFGIYD